jgi:hypothetical protein
MLKSESTIDLADFETERCSVLCPPIDPSGYVWTFYLDPADGSETRFITRTHSPRRSTFLGRVLERTTWVPAYFLVQREMFLRENGGAEASAETCPHDP